MKINSHTNFRMLSIFALSTIIMSVALHGFYFQGVSLLLLLSLFLAVFVLPMAIGEFIKQKHSWINISDNCLELCYGYYFQHSLSLGKLRHEKVILNHNDIKEVVFKRNFIQKATPYTSIGISLAETVRKLPNQSEHYLEFGNFLEIMPLLDFCKRNNLPWQTVEGNS